METLTQIIVALNSAANVVGRFLLAPIGHMPGWLSATLIGIVTGLLMLITFKYTSNQRAIKRVRGGIRANLLALKLFKDSFPVVPRSLSRVMVGAARLLLLAVVPVLIMTPPMVLLLGQMSLWYDARPLSVDPPVRTFDQKESRRKATVTLKLKDNAQAKFPSVVLQPDPAFDVTVGPALVKSDRSVSWEIQAKSNGYHRLTFLVDGQKYEKELAVGDGYMRVSTLRPASNWWTAATNPLEKPFAADSPVQWIKIEYPERPEWMSGKETWFVWWLIVSFATAFLFRRAFNVKF